MDQGAWKESGKGLPSDVYSSSSVVRMYLAFCQASRFPCRCPAGNSGLLRNADAIEQFIVIVDDICYDYIYSVRRAFDLQNLSRIDQ